MVMRRTLTSLLIFFLLTLFCVAQQVEIRQVPIKHVDPTSGEKMYAAYCAACHGADGKGMGPAASATKVPPANLTVLAKNNRGKYPAAHVSAVIYGDTMLASSHRVTEMPAWDTAFSSLHPGTHTTRAEVLMRVNNINDYVKSMQVN